MGGRPFRDPKMGLLPRFCEANSQPRFWTAESDGAAIRAGRGRQIYQGISASRHFIFQNLSIDLSQKGQLPHKIVDLLLTFAS